MISVFLCDDNQILITNYCDLITQIAEYHHILLSIKTFTSGEQLLFHSENNPNDADIIYLDVLMDGTNGIDTAKKLRAMDCHAEIIFLTSSNQYVFDSFDVNPLSYILKSNADNKRFEDVFLKAVDRSKQKEQEVFICENAGITKQIPLRNISHFEVRNRIVTVHFNDSSFNFYSKLETVEHALRSGHFVRCHRSYLVNMKHIDEIGKNFISLLDGTIIPVGSVYLKPLKLEFSSYISDSM